MSFLGRIYNGVFHALGASSDDGDASVAVLTAKRKVGNKGEDHALKLLRRRGHKLVSRNWSCKSGELDLVTWHGETLVFTEVRTRSSTNFGTPAETVNPRKQERMRRAAHWFLSRHYPDGRLPSCRYDVVWVLMEEDEIYDAGIIEGAFC